MTYLAVVATTACKRQISGRVTVPEQIRDVYTVNGTHWVPSSLDYYQSVTFLIIACNRTHFSPHFSVRHFLDKQRLVYENVRDDYVGLFCDIDVIGSDVPWLECPACNALTWVKTVTE